jgi:hypothetical protein
MKFYDASSACCGERREERAVQLQPIKANYFCTYTALPVHFDLRPSSMLVFRFTAEHIFDL